ncbi:Transcription termination factor, mitochondrial/chloroplastic [Sesbania bispinosa]|nr:Transcription termination factor, mitochondrial/chloroplastic [Sesbania bispinosa]
MFKAFLYRNGFAITRKSTTPKLDPLLRYLPFSFSLTFFSTTTSDSDPHPFAVSYLINNFGFSPESALKASKRSRFKTSEKPDSVVTFFRNHGFPEPVIRSIIRREPWLLSCDLDKRVVPKFQFLLSKGASTSDVVRMASGSPRFLQLSLEKKLIPAYQFVNRFVESDDRTLASILYCPTLLYSKSLAENVKLLIDNGVASSNISRILRLKPYVLCSTKLGKIVQEVKDLGFDPSKSYFGDALLAKRATSKSKWDEKIDTYKRWGWSEETILEAFKKQPQCMLRSSDKINRVMQFWVNQLGWDSSYLVKAPGIFSYSLEKWVIPRASVVHYLLSKGLRSKNASLLAPFFVSEKVFLQMCVTCFDEEEASKILKLYKGKMNVIDKGTQGNRAMSCS